MKATRRTANSASPPRISLVVLRVFAAYCRRYLRKNFHSFRVLKDGLPPQDISRPVVIFLNHASWWDPLVCLLLSREFLQDRSSFAPIETAMFQRYGFFKYLGFFPVDPQSSKGARQFLGMARSLLATSQNALWLTPQGRFMDVRERPLRLQGGLGALAVQEPRALFIPLAIEYSFWTEPHPEILVSFGEPIIPEEYPTVSANEWTDRFSDALEITQDELAARSCRRDATEWMVLNQGRSGTNAIYNTWQRIRSKMRGETYSADHHTEAK